MEKEMIEGKFETYEVDTGHDYYGPEIWDIVKAEEVPRCRYRWGHNCDHKEMKKDFNHGKCPFHYEFSGKTCEGYKG